MRRQTVLFTLLTVLVVGGVVLLVLWAIRSHDAAIKTMTSQAPVTIVAGMTVQDQSQSDEQTDQYVVVYRYTAASRKYTVQASFGSKDEFTGFAAKGVKTCYDPANPASSALVGASFTCGTPSGEAVISDPAQTSP